MSPVWSQPSSSIVAAVASGLLRYPCMTCGPCTQTSPSLPTPRFSPVSGSTILVAVLGTVTPTDPGL